MCLCRTSALHLLHLLTPAAGTPADVAGCQRSCSRQCARRLLYVHGWTAAVSSYSLTAGGLLQLIHLRAPLATCLVALTRRRRPFLPRAFLAELVWMVLVLICVSAADARAGPARAGGASEVCTQQQRHAAARCRAVLGAVATERCSGSVASGGLTVGSAWLGACGSTQAR